MSKLDPLTRDAISDTMMGWELVEYLQIPIDTIIDLLEDEILENIDDVEEYVGIKTRNADDNGDEEYTNDEQY